uniref:Glutathione transferase n=1 Tax=Rhodosorus marinus TaxID=101924 RepID=A0A7S2ZKZ7_9RHOD|eukprot:CAMPEP_0113966606 /NCGR_PEP_ID=MMETSP0011_2-20120614/8418_1 /TAXON_ID=101924 /ORGANISM="Rhodosorus marinus" /LENGTH=218 /DNA_ID=CAMNT_0000979297 /DNA_START=26 /DNA_END=682 /DNA_ORIENTATION=+ /assembly_acc=CAM_ASM_000156
MIGFQSVSLVGGANGTRRDLVCCNLISYYRASTNRSRSAQVDWLIAELNIEDEINYVKLDMGQEEHKDPAKNAHPFSKVPCMKLDDKNETVIFESANILGYLAKRFDGLDLSEEQRREMESWIIWLNASFGPAVVNEKTRERGYESLDVIENVLKTRDYMCTFNKFTAADVAVTYLLSTLGRLLPGFPNFEESHPALAAYIAKNQAREAYQKSLVAQA